MEPIEDILQRMYDRHKFMIKKYYLCPLDFRKETPEEFVKNRCETVEFRMKNNTFDYKIKIKQTCWIDIEKYTCYFKTQYYIDDNPVKKNIKFLRELIDFTWFEGTEITYPLSSEEEKKTNNKTEGPEQLSLFDLM